MRLRMNGRRVDRLEHLNQRQLEALAEWTEPHGDDVQASLALDPDGAEFRARYWLAALEIEGADATARALLAMGSDAAALDFVALALPSIVASLHGDEATPPMPRVKSAGKLYDPGRGSDAQADLTALLFALAERVVGSSVPS